MLSTINKAVVMDIQNMLIIIDTFYKQNPVLLISVYVSSVILLLCIFFLIKQRTSSEDDEPTTLLGHIKHIIAYYRVAEFSNDSKGKLPHAPTDKEKYLYTKRRNFILTFFSTISFLGIGFSTLHFLHENPALWPFFIYLVLTAIYFVISLVVNLFSRDFDLKKHNLIKEKWESFLTARVDIFLPTAGESLDVLQNTWIGITELEENYQGSMSIYVLDDSGRREVKQLADEYGFNYIVRPKQGWFKKAGNLRYGYKVSNGEYIAIFDADFRPRKDFLRELLPYFYEYKDIGIVQSPQFFDVNMGQNWLQRGAGAVQELFYRVSQVSRQSHNASICVGTNAVYRRQALAETGGTALIQHSEDVHTGFNIRMRGWTIQYVPIILAKGLCPNDMQAFFKQQYRWCLGSMTLLSSKKFWQLKLSLVSRFSYLSGFLYYIHTAISSLIIPIIPIVILIYYPDQVSWQNYLYILPSILFVQLIYPLWHNVTYGIEAWSTRSIYGWAHLFAIMDTITKNAMSWQPTGAKIGGDSRYTLFRILQILFNLIPALLWVALAGEKVIFERNILFLPLFIGGTYFYLMCAKVSFYAVGTNSQNFFSTIQQKLVVKNAFAPITLALVSILGISFLTTSVSNFAKYLVTKETPVTYAQKVLPITKTPDGSVLRMTNERLVNSWIYYKKTFITVDGQSIDPDREYKTTSEGQSYIMLRSVMMNDEAMFTSSWNWTKGNLQHKGTDTLFSWLWGETSPGKEAVIEKANATDADEDIALALILAGYRWGDTAHIDEAKEILNDLWEKNVVDLNGRYYFLAGSQFAKPDGYVINPSYLSPASYKVFAVLDKSHPWDSLAKDSYVLLDEISTSSLSTVSLPPNWVLVRKNGTLASAKDYIETNTDVYGYDAFRTFWRVSLDAHWFDSKDARDYLVDSQEFFQKEWQTKKQFMAVYDENGKPTVQHTSISTDTGPLSIFMITDPSVSTEIYNQIFLKQYNKSGYWGNGKNYYDQNWAWFATALYTDNFTLPEAL